MLLHEVIIGSEVKFQVAFLLSGEERLVPALRVARPGLEVLQKIYAACAPLGQGHFET